MIAKSSGNDELNISTASALIHGNNRHGRWLLSHEFRRNGRSEPRACPSRGRRLTLPEVSASFIDGRPLIDDGNGGGECERQQRYPRASLRTVPPATVAIPLDFHCRQLIMGTAGVWLLRGVAAEHSRRTRGGGDIILAVYVMRGLSVCVFSLAASVSERAAIAGRSCCGCRATALLRPDIYGRYCVMTITSMAITGGESQRRL